MPDVLHEGSKYKVDALLQFGIKWAGPNPKLQHHCRSLQPHLAVGCEFTCKPTRAVNFGFLASLAMEGSNDPREQPFPSVTQHLPFFQHPCCWSVGDPLTWRQVESPECLGLHMFFWRKGGRVKYSTEKTRKGYMLCWGQGKDWQARDKYFPSALHSYPRRRITSLISTFLCSCQWEIKQMWSIAYMLGRRRGELYIYLQG